MNRLRNGITTLLIAMIIALCWLTELISGDPLWMDS